MQENKKIKLAQVTDIHIGPEDILYNNINVRENFLKTLEDVQRHAPFDALILSGDLAIDFGEIEAYYWIKEQLKNIDIPVIIMAGNHDSVERMDRVFDLSSDIKDGMLYFEREINGLPILFLDSEPDVVHKIQLEWMVEKSSQIKENILLFVHHPPAVMDAQFMDRKYPLRNAKETFSYINKCNNISHIFAGHYHSEGTAEINNKIVYITPATQMQIGKRNLEFEISDYRPGWRSIEWDGINLSTKVHYISN